MCLFIRYIGMYSWLVVYLCVYVYFALLFDLYNCTECESVTNKVHVPNLFIPFDNRILSCIPEPELESSLRLSAESLIFNSQNLHQL